MLCLKNKIDHALEKYGEHSKEHLDAYDRDEPMMVCVREDEHEGDCRFVDSSEVKITFKSNRGG